MRKKSSAMRHLVPESFRASDAFYERLHPVLAMLAILIGALMLIAGSSAI
jgi:hypothetical protein